MSLNPGLAVKLMLEMGRRAQPDHAWWKPETVGLAGEAAGQAAYCLDAPDHIPGGGMYADEIAGEPLPMDLTVGREG